MEPVSTFTTTSPRPLGGGDPNLFGSPMMIPLTPPTRIFLALEPVDFRKGIDGLAAVCRHALRANPLEGAVYVFRNRSGTALKLLFYDQYLRQNGEPVPDRRQIERDLMQDLWLSTRHPVSACGILLSNSILKQRTYTHSCWLADKTSL